MGTPVLGEHEELYRLDTSKTTTPTLRLVIPTELTQLILRTAHLETGHTGLDKLLMFLHSRYWWPRLNTDSMEFLDRCDNCTQHEPSSLKPPMGQVPTSPFPLHTLTIDTIAMPRSQHGFTKILTVVDNLSNYVFLYPLQNETSQTIANIFLDRFIPQNGFFSHLVSDNAPSLAAGTFAQILTHFGVKMKTTLPYTPQANKTERRNRDIIHVLRKITTDIKNWPDHVPMTQLALNITPSPISALSPYEIFHGRKPLTLTDLLLQLPVFRHQFKRKANGISEEQAQRYAEMLNHAIEAVKDTHDKNAAYRNTQRNVQTPDWQPGQKVWKKTFTYPTLTQKKLLPKFESGFVIEKVISPQTVIIKNLKTGTQQRIHTSHLKSALADPPGSVVLETPG